MTRTSRPGTPVSHLPGWVKARRRWTRIAGAIMITAAGGHTRETLKPAPARPGGRCRDPMSSDRADSESRVKAPSAVTHYTGGSD